jgi:hypothetical protein
VERVIRFLNKAADDEIRFAVALLRRAAFYLEGAPASSMAADMRDWAVQMAKKLESETS